MKKAISLILALVLCLGLCACGEGNNTTGGNGDNGSSITATQTGSTTTQTGLTTTPIGTTEDPAILEQKDKDYSRALQILESVSGTVRPESPPNIQEAYELLASLGDYEQAAQYLACIKIIPDVLLKAEYYYMNAFGEENLTYWSHYGYNADGTLIYAPGNYQEGTYSFYSYNNDGTIASVKIAWSADQTRRIDTYHYNNGSLVGVTSLSDNGSTEEQVWQNGLMVSKSGEDYVGTFTYDENGLLMKEEWKISNDTKSVGQYEYEFDSDGNMIRSVAHFNIGGYKMDVIREYTYENGRLVAESFDEQNTAYKIVYLYGDYYCYTPNE